MFGVPEAFAAWMPALAEAGYHVLAPDQRFARVSA